MLIVDDDGAIRRSVSELLVDAGYDVRAAVQGYGAMDLLAAGRFVPDVIVLDAQMPAMDGQTFLEALEQLDGGGRSAILGITASPNPPAEWCDRCEEILHKPFEGEALLAAVLRAMRRHASR